MAVRLKNFIPEHTYFITFTICSWQKVFINRKYVDLVYKWFDYQKQNYDNEINGYVVMPNHIHVLIYISKKSPHISKLIQNAKRFLAYGIVRCLEEDNHQNILTIFRKKARKEKGAKHKVFEDRYDSQIAEDEYIFEQKLDYIHQNPCQDRYKLVDSPEQYPYSSASNYYLGKGIYPVDLA
jgi:putative transposase